MARDRANLRTDMWASTEWRLLSTGAQWLYMYLLTTPTLSYVGIADWRPARIAAKVADATPADIEARCEELTRRRFAYVDDETEEVLIRSFLRHDGLLLNPNLWRSIGNAFADAASDRLRGIVAGEIQRLRDENPNGLPTAKGSVNPWTSPHLSTALDTPAHTPTDTPLGTPSETPSREEMGRGSPTTTATATATSSKEERVTPNTSRRVSEGIKKSPYSKDFLEFWEMGLRKDDKMSAWRAWEKARKAGLLPDLPTLKAAVQNYLKHHPDPTYRKYPATWLNAAGWENDYTPQPTTTTPRRVFNDDADD